MLKAAPVPRNEARGERLCYQTPGHIPWEGLVKDAMASAVHSAGELEINSAFPDTRHPKNNHVLPAETVFDVVSAQAIKPALREPTVDQDGVECIELIAPETFVNCRRFPEVAPPQFIGMPRRIRPAQYDKTGIGPFRCP